MGSGRFTPGNETRYSLHRKVGGPQGRSGRVREISSHRDSIPEPSSPYRVAIQTTLPQLHSLTSALDGGDELNATAAIPQGNEGGGIGNEAGRDTESDGRFG